MYFSIKKEGASLKRHSNLCTWQGWFWCQMYICTSNYLPQDV